MPVKHVHSDSEFESVVNGGGGTGTDTLYLVDYSASWCGPCKNIAPVFEALSNKHGHANFRFIHVDVDECTEISQSQGIRALPTFVFYKNSTSTELSRIQGADASKLEAKIKEYAPKFQASFGGQGNKLGGEGSTEQPKVSASGEPSNLSLEEMIQIAQANIEYSLSTCCRIGLRFQPAVQTGVLNGGKPFFRINPSEKISKFRDFIDTLLELSGVKSTSYELHNSYPPGKLDESVTVSDGGVAGAMVIVKFK